MRGEIKNHPYFRSGACKLNMILPQKNKNPASHLEKQGLVFIIFPPRSDVQKHMRYSRIVKPVNT